MQRDTSPRELQEHFDRAAKLRSELRKKENRIKRQAQQLAWGVAALMEPGQESPQDRPEHSRLRRRRPHLPGDRLPRAARR